jgi:hypothetical protein
MSAFEPYRYIICSPPYNPCSGGPRQLHYLAFLLQAVNIPVAMTVPCWFVPDMPVVMAAREGDIGVYSDLTVTNPLQAKRVVRYALGLLDGGWKVRGGPLIPKSECILFGMASMRFHSAEILAHSQAHCEQELTEANLAFIPCITEREWLFAETPKTIENVLYQGYKSWPYPPETASPCVVIPPVPATEQMRHRMRTLALLRRARTFYTQDHYTVMEAEALLCGCRVMRVKEQGACESVITQEQARAQVCRPSEDAPLGIVWHKKVERHFSK